MGENIFSYEGSIQVIALSKRFMILNKVLSVHSARPTYGTRLAALQFEVVNRSASSQAEA